MLILRQYTTDSCAVCKAHKPLLAELEKAYKGELKLEFVNVNTLPIEESQNISTVPFYKLFHENGAVVDLWTGTKSKQQIVSVIESALE